MRFYRYFIFVITTGILILSSYSCTTKTKHEVYGNRVQEGVILYLEVSDITPEEASDFYYLNVREFLSIFGSLPLPDTIPSPWAFAILGFNPLNYQLQYLLISENLDTVFNDYDIEVFDDISMLFDEEGRDVGGYTQIEGKIYLCIGNSSKRFLTDIRENKKPFVEIEDFKICSEYFKGGDWLIFYIPGTVFKLIEMVPDEYLESYKLFRFVRNFEISAVAGNISGQEDLFLRLNVLSDTNIILFDVTFKGWNPEEIHSRITESLDWNQ